MRRVRPIKSPVIESILRLSFVIGIALLPGLCATGQVKFTTIISSQDVGKSDYLQVEFVVENARQIDDLTPPEFPGFRIAQGPIQSSGMSIVNGNMSQYKALSFVLEPIKTGKFTIGGAVATVDGKHMRSNTVAVNVHPGGSGSANSGAPPAGGGNPFGGNPFFQPSMPDPFGPAPGEVDRDYVLKPGENVKEKIRKSLFVKVQVDKSTCYVGEPIVATYKLYTRLSSESRITKRPSLNGFSVYDMIDPSSDAVSVEKLNGKNFTVHTIRKTQLIPLQAGTIDLDQMEVENTVHFVKGNGRQGAAHNGNTLRDLLDQMADESNMGPEVDENITLDTKPLAITVKPLPEENKPAGYNGAVGNFSVEASLNKKTLAAEDEATLHVVVKGKGNLPVIAAPAVNWPDGVRAFDPTVKEDVNKTVAPMTGTKSFDFTFTPRTPGHYTIPAVSFPYFDPASQSYKTAGSQPLDIQVTPAIRNKHTIGTTAKVWASPSNDMSGFAREHLEWIAAFVLLSFIAIYFWRQNLRLKKSGAGKKDTAVEKAGGQSGKAGAIGLSAPTGQGRSNGPMASVGQGGAAGQRGSGSQGGAAGPSGSAGQGGLGNAGGSNDPGAIGRGGSVNPATPGLTTPSYVPAVPVVDPLQEAKQLLESGDSKGFYREVNRAIWKAMSRKFDLPASELNKQNSLRQLQLRGWDDTSLLSLENILNECEMNLYTPAYDRWNMQQLLMQAERILDRLA